MTKPRSSSFRQSGLLRTPLLVMVMSAALLCILAALALISENRKHTIEAANRENSNISRLVGFHISHLLNTGVRLLDSVAMNVEEHGLSQFQSKEGKQFLLSRVQGFPELQTMLLIGKSGQLLVGASTPFPPPDINYADRDYFLLHKSGQNLVYGEQLMSRSHGRRGTTISRAIRSRHGELEGIVLITIESSHFAELFQLAQRTDDQEITVLRKDGAIFVRVPEIETGRRIPQADVFSRVSNNSRGTYEGRSAIDNLPRLFAYEQLKDYPLLVVASQHTDRVLRSWRLFTGTICAGLALALILLGVASRYAFKSATETETLQLELERLAHTDSLTGLANRRHFMTLAERELSRTTRYGGSLAVLMMDLDHFKKVNDTYGHATGDIVLQSLSKLLMVELRDIDIVGRLGGEEFAIVLSQSDGLQAMEVAERLRRTIEETGVVLPQGLPLYITVSIGVSVLSAQETNIEILLSQADEALYEAKRTGRNRVQAFWETSSHLSAKVEVLKALSACRSL
ncbi:MAG: sensor domain-containing diguanylate cyclase [Betaproteobacteria bacterium]